MSVKSSVNTLLLFIAGGLCSTGYASEKYAQESFWLSIADHSADFFNLHAYSEQEGVYYSEVDSEGQVVNGKIHLIALSRMIYAQAYLAEQGLADIRRAESAASFLLSRMVKEDEFGPYFVSQVQLNENADILADKDQNQIDLVVNEQAYGLSGLVELYRVSGDRKLLKKIRNFYQAFVRRFHDSQSGGFFDRYSSSKETSDTGRPTHSHSHTHSHTHRHVQSQTKSYNSTVYVATSFLISLMEADPGRKRQYQDKLSELVHLAAKHFPDKETGWIIENFDRHWVPQWRGWQQQGPHSIGIVGHNLQYAWLLLRASEWDFIDIKQRGNLKSIAYQVIDSMLAKPSWDAEHGGFLDAFQRETSAPMWHTNKAWWQQAEGLMALSAALYFQSDDLGQERAMKYQRAKTHTIDFFTRFFIDKTYGGEFFNVSQNGQAIEDELKGQKGKSAYHSTELAKFMIRYQLK